MIKAFLRLWLFVLLPVYLLVVNTPFSPLFSVMNYFEKSYLIANYHGTFTLIENTGCPSQLSIVCS